MNLLIFSSGVPFAYLAFWSALVAAFIGSTIIAVMRWRSTPRGSMWGPLSVLFVALLVAIVNVDRDLNLDANPLFTDATLVGEWTDGRAVLDMQQNGEFRCRGRACRELGMVGRWERRETFDIAFHPQDKPMVVRRVVVFHHHFYLAHPIISDPDLWNGQLTFKSRARAI